MSSVLILGKPNSGKSLLFSRLTGLHQKVANFPGVTVDVKSGHWEDIECIDFPGIYSFDALTKDEEVAISNFRQALKDEKVNFEIGIYCCDYFLCSKCILTKQ